MKNENMYLPFHTPKFWNDYYLNDDLNIMTDWYFNLVNYKSNLFDVSKWDRNSEIIILGVGNSNFIDFLINEKFKHVTLVDFSEVLINHLKNKYENLPACGEWDCKIYLTFSCL
jgi:hypothetical protein